MPVRRTSDVVDEAVARIVVARLVAVEAEVLEQVVVQRGDRDPRRLVDAAPAAGWPRGPSPPASSSDRRGVDVAVLDRGDDQRAADQRVVVAAPRPGHERSAPGPRCRSWPGDQRLERARPSPRRATARRDRRRRAPRRDRTSSPPPSAARRRAPTAGPTPNPRWRRRGAAACPSAPARPARAGCRRRARTDRDAACCAACARRRRRSGTRSRRPVPREDHLDVVRGPRPRRWRAAPRRRAARCRRPRPRRSPAGRRPSRGTAPACRRRGRRCGRRRSGWP